MVTTPTEARRVKCILISQQGMLSILKSMSVGYVKVTGLPDDLKCVGAGYDINIDTFRLLVEHQSFDMVPLGEIYPTLPITIHDIRNSLIPFKS